MSLISVNNLTFSYDGSYDYIFKDVSFCIDTDWKLGFIGRNGRGKTTFLNLLQKKYEYSGKITHSVAFDYFPFPIKDKSKNTIDIIYEINPNPMEWEIERELNMLQLDGDCLYRPFDTLSNGEQSKVMLAALFLKEGNFLLIDEPTNHLDSDARKAVSGYLNKKKGFILISHDRDFLDGCVSHILSINKTNIELQKGNYTSWQLNKSRQDSYEIAQNERLLTDIDRLKEASRRKAGWSAAAEKAKIGNGACDRGFVGSKAAKVMKSAKTMENRQNKAIEEKSALLKNIEKFQDLKMNCLTHHAKKLVEIRDLSVFYGEKEVFSNFNLEINQGDRIALFGKNGCGKSSLLKLLIGQKIAHFGDIFIANGLKISYVKQDTSDLTGSIGQFIAKNHIDETLFKTILTKLDFCRIQFEKDIGDYSDGQKKKLLIAKSLCENAHLYFWDEPLNYIDILSRLQIEELLKNYSPTILFVEHDTVFIKAIATKKLRIN